MTTMTDIIDKHAGAYTGVLTPIQEKDMHFVQALMKMLDRQRDEAYSHLQHMSSTDVSRLMNIAATMPDPIFLKKICEGFPKLARGEALVQAAGHGTGLCVMAVRPRGRKTKKGERAFRAAAINGNDDALIVLSNWIDYGPVMEQFDQEGNCQAMLNVLRATKQHQAASAMEARMSREELVEAVGAEEPQQRAKRKM
ncbi:hypothetical protein [Pseudoxanthomonas mexicana]